MAQANAAGDGVARPRNVAATADTPAAGGPAAIPAAVAPVAGPAVAGATGVPAAGVAPVAGPGVAGGIVVRMGHAQARFDIEAVLLGPLPTRTNLGCKIHAELMTDETWP